MKNEDLILMLVDKSTNAFGELFGLAQETKFKIALTIIQETIVTAFGINCVLLTSETLADILEKGRIDIEQSYILTNLLLVQAELLLKSRKSIESLGNYENALQIIQWQTMQPVERNHFEKQNKITELKAVIESLKMNSEINN